MAFPKLEPLPTFGKKKDKLAYLHKQPKIKPNYGKPESYLPKTNVSRVLLYDNAMQEQMLDVQLKYINKQRSRVFGMLEKSRYAFREQQMIRQKWHDIWTHRYLDMKEAFISQFGTEFIPVPTPEPAEIDPFLINARLVPPINILCYYLDTDDTSKKSKAKSKHHDKLVDGVEPTTASYFYDSDRIMEEFTRNHSLYTNSVEDPRFRNLQECLVPPRFHNDGYLQLSPGYLKEAYKVKRKPANKDKGGIVLPRFYASQRLASRDSARSKNSALKKSDSFTNLSERGDDDVDEVEDSNKYGDALTLIGRQ